MFFFFVFVFIKVTENNIFLDFPYLTWKSKAAQYGLKISYCDYS